jgi:hypothetical protein
LAGDGVANVAKPTVAAVAIAIIAFLIFVSSSSAQNKNRQVLQRFQIGTLAETATPHLI